MSNVVQMNGVPLRRYNRILFSDVMRLPEGMPGDGNDLLGFIYNLGRAKSWDVDRDIILSDEIDEIADLTVESQVTLEGYAREWAGKPRTAESLRAAADLGKQQRLWNRRSKELDEVMGRKAAAYLIDHVEGPFEALPAGDKPETWKLLDPVIINWLIHPTTIEGVLQQLDGPLSIKPSTPQSDFSFSPEDEETSAEATETAEVALISQTE